MSQEADSVRQWLVEEVKLERYFDKLVRHGYDSLQACCSIDGHVLDEMGVIPPYHRKRLLKYAEELRTRYAPSSLCLDAEPGRECTPAPLDNQFESNSPVREALPPKEEEEEAATGPPPILPPKLQKSTLVGRSSSKPKPQVPVRLSSFDRKTVPPAPRPDSPDFMANVNNEQKDFRRESAKSPPPVPPRSDLNEQTESTSAEAAFYVNSGGDENLINSAPELSRIGCVEGNVARSPSPKAKPMKPPRRSAPKVPTRGNQTPGAQAPSSVDGREIPAGEVNQDSETAHDSNPDANLYVNTPTARPTPKPPVRGVTYPLPTGQRSTSPHPGELTSSNGLAATVKQECTPYVNVSPHQPSTAANPLPFPTWKPVPAPRRAHTEKKEHSGYAERFDKDPHLKPATTRPTSTLLQENKAFMSDLSKKLSIKSLDRNTKIPAVTSSPKSPGRILNSQDMGRTDVSSPPPTDSTYEEVGMPSAGPGKVCADEDQYEVLPRKPHSDSNVSRETIGDGFESDDSLDDVVQDVIIKSSSIDSGDGVDSGRPTVQSPNIRKHEGYLFKQGGQQNNKGWRRRWFVFDGKDLRYYKDKDSMRETLHIIPVSQMKNVEFVTDTKRACFNLETPNRVFMLASEDRTDMTLWAQTLQAAILQFKADESQQKPGGAMSNPNMEGWLKKQGHNVVADWKRRYVVIKDDLISYYDTYEDFFYDTKINCIKAALAKVKTVDGHRSRFQIVTPHKSYCFQAENEGEASEWIVGIEEAIQEGLGDREVANQVSANPSNKWCADCGKPDPVWASINFCVCVCAQCIGVHRNLGVQFSKPRSLLMDERVWNPALVKLMVTLGNENVNKLLECKMPEDDKITPKATKERRREFINDKYKDKKYIKYHPEFGNLDALGKCLRQNVVTDDLMLTMELIINKADIRYVPPDSPDQCIPLDLAVEAGQELQAELLRQNGADQAKIETSISMEDVVSDDWKHSGEVITRESYEKEGFLQRKETGWKKRWFMLKELQLKYSRTPHDKDEMGAIDLRTVTSLVKAPNDNALLLDIVTADKTHSLRAETEEEVESWYHKLRSKQVFGVPLSEQALGSDGIPHLVAKCLQFVETYGGLEMEGVYRVSGSQAKIKELKLAFNQDAGGKLLTLDECGVHDITGSLKLYLRELPDPVIPGAMYKQFLAASTMRESTSRLQTLKGLISSLPKENHATLKSIICHLTKVVSFQSVNKMGVPNVSLIFGPTLMSNPSTGEMSDLSINNEVKIISEMIMKYQYLFDVKDEELRKDEAVQNALEKMRKLEEMLKSGEDKALSPGIVQEFTLDIYIRRKDDTPFRMKVNSNMTAGKICMEIVHKRGLEQEGNWALFEVIGNRNIERAFQVREKVLPSFMSLARLGLGHDNFLIVKENYIAEQIAPYVGCLTMEGQLQIRDPKKGTWKHSAVELKNGFMGVDKGKSFFKSIKLEKSDVDYWPLFRVTLYIGVHVEKHTKGVDTSCGFTVVVKSDQPDQEDTLRFMCAKDKAEMHRWVAAILNMKHPEGIWSDPGDSSRMSFFGGDESKQSRGEEVRIYLGRQSSLLRKQGSSKPIAHEIQMRRKSLRRSVHKPRT